jgi:hypothetical protein
MPYALTGRLNRSSIGLLPVSADYLHMYTMQCRLNREKQVDMYKWVCVFTNAPGLGRQTPTFEKRNMGAGDVVWKGRNCGTT